MTWRAGARMFAMLANGGQLAGIRLLPEDRLRAATGARPGAYDVDIVTGLVHWLGAGGYELGGTGPLTDPVGGEGDHILAAVGGSIGWADLDTRLAVVIAHNRIFGRLPRDENPLMSIGDALRELVHHD